MILLLMMMAITVAIKTKKYLHMLQQNLYNENNRYLKWVFKNGRLFFHLDLLCMLLLACDAMFFAYTTALFQMILALTAFLYASYDVIFYRYLKKDQQKKPLVITARVKRLLVTTTILYLIPVVCFFLFYGDLKATALCTFLFSLLLYGNAFVLLLANTINKYTVEKYVYHHFKKQAIQKLHGMSNLKVVGITGSYGKTSSKNILSDILNIKYIARPTPRNLNTPYGLIMTINNHLDKFDDILIAEMGAYKRGEIKELCDLIHPKYGILTRIGTAHLESFGSEENIQKTKFELIESLPLDGVGVLNKDDPKQVSYDLKNSCKILWIGIESKDVDVHASNIKCSSHGTKFDVTFKGDKKKYAFETKLLGDHNVYNILASLALGREFGISIEKLQQAVRLVKPVEHRLELKKLGNFYQIDDAYNSNPTGAASACKVLGMMPGVKVVVTPGMVELGEKEEEYNEIFGEQIASVADYVVLIGEKKTKPIEKGLLNKKFDMEKVVVYNDVRDAYTFLRGLKTKKDIYALFENDLPDTYNE